MFTKILAPIDLAEDQMTKYSVSYAEAMARAFDADLRLVNVQTLIPIAFLDYTPQDFAETTRRNLEAQLAAIAAGVDRPADRISTRLLFGPVYQRVLEEADDWGGDVILLCSHRPERQRFLIGSNASAIVRHANCSVLVLR